MHLALQSETVTNGFGCHLVVVNKNTFSLMLALVHTESHASACTWLGDTVKTVQVSVETVRKLAIINNMIFVQTANRTQLCLVQYFALYNYFSLWQFDKPYKLVIATIIAI